MSTFSQIYMHIVFAVKGRASLITDDIEVQVHKYITGIVQMKGQKMIAINGMPDHIHLFIGMKTDCQLSDLVREVKKSSNAYIRTLKPGLRFFWQEGFGAFSCSHSHIDRVARYVMAQKAHHAKKSFRDEFIEFLKEYGIGYDEKYLFDWIE